MISCNRKKGRSPIGGPLVLRVPNIRSRNISICCLMNRYAVAYKEINFGQYNNQRLILQASIILDCFTKKGIEIYYLPPYSPFLNHVEKVFSKWEVYAKSSRPEDEPELFYSMTDGLATIA
ncbi:hypothetical protein RF11_03335 [Thelohanellus kitauei]|uniref:Tc1-like transposase DDE domain-containing protein n=1 Tax=Thelohanellus kitauei TaxID=669202 RepID=A0A0C2MCI4_THEKT|nr:hypothetical protein RF11_03335 [Thelohanellus kitauei]